MNNLSKKRKQSKSDENTKKEVKRKKLDSSITETIPQEEKEIKPSHPNSKLIDHTILKPEASETDIQRIVNEAKEHGFYSVCVNPFWAKTVSSSLRGTGIKTCIVVGFPLGSNKTEIKVKEAQQALKDGAEEIDMVMNVGALKSKMLTEVENDIRSVVKAVKKKAKVKVILETCLLTEEEKIEACKIAKKAGADFVKTSTGFSKSGATVEDIKLMRETVGAEIGVKASGGIRTKEDLEKMVNAGASRIGASASVDIIKGFVNENNQGNY